MSRKGRIVAADVLSSARIVAPQGGDDDTPRWCFRYLQPAWNVSRLSVDQKAAFLDALDRRGAMPWKEIKLQSRTKLGFEAIGEAQIAGQKPDIVSGQTILCFRIGDVGRFLGARNGHTFHVVWIDFTFTLYKH